jgi:hypothetical protein
MGYSTIFMRFAWQIRPRNYFLFACHGANVLAQANLYRIKKKKEKLKQIAASQQKI